MIVSQLVSDVDRVVERFRLTLRLFDYASDFLVCSFCCFYFLLKVHVNFSSVFYCDYRAVVTSSRHLPFCFHNFVFLLNSLFVLCNAHRISVCVISVNKSHEFLLKVRRLSSFFRRRRLYAFTSTRRNFFPQRRKGFDFDDESMFFPRHRTLVQVI